MEVMVYECRDCQYQTSVKCNWEKHLKTKKHQLIINKLKENVKYVEIHPKNVEHCDLKNINCDSIRTNKIIQNSELMCEWCKRFYSRKDSLQRHLMYCKYRVTLNKNDVTSKLSSNINLLKCKFCQLDFKYKSGLSRHQKKCFLNHINQLKQI